MGSQQDSAPPPHPGAIGRRWGGTPRVLLGITVLGAAMAVLTLAARTMVRPAGGPLAQAAASLFEWMLWVPLFGLVHRVAARAHRSGSGLEAAGFHLGAALGLSLLHTGISVVGWGLAGWIPAGHAVGAFALRLGREQAIGNGIAYGVLAAASHALAYVADLRRAEEDLRRSQEQLFQSQKMEAVGRLAGGVAHDFNNLLTVIGNYTALVLEDMPEHDPRRQDLLEVHRASDRAAGLTRQLLAFSRRQVMKPRAIDLAGAANEMAGMLRRLIGEDIQLVVRPRPGTGLAEADPVQVEQILLNLVVNARDAISGPGTVTIETANADLDHEFARLHQGARPGSYIMLAVGDTGCGMDRETQRRIFEPFFTTKPVGQGTGLGLSTVYGIVKQSGGYIAVYSEPGHGSVFRVYLPRAGAEQPTPLIPGLVPAPVGAALGTILVVEDEDTVRELVRKVLERRGFRIHAAANGHAALELAARLQEPIHLLLTDVVMPELNGRELVDRLRLSHPGLQVVFMSGYTDDALASRGALGPEVRFLAKPFATRDLLKTVQEALDAGAGAGAAQPA
ncbi:MAG: response regulator [Gemmatimonadales bacterium]